MSNLIEILKKGLAANPGDWNIRKGLIEQYALAKDPAGLAEVIEGAPAMCEDEGVATEIAGILSGASDDAARSFVEKATEKFPTNAALHGVAAKLQLAAGDMARAGDHYAAAKTFDPNFADADLDAVSHLMASASQKMEAGAAAEVPAAPEAEVAEVVEEAPAEVVEQAQEVVAEEAPEVVAEVAEEVVEEVVVPEAVEASPVMDMGLEEEDVEAVPEEGGAAEFAAHPVEDLASAVSAVPIQGLTGAATVELTYDELEPEVDLNFTPKEELELTRQHLKVLAPDGDEVDADHFVEELAEAHGDDDAHLLVAEPGVVPGAAERQKKKETVIAILSTIGAHVVIFALIGLIIVAAPRMLPPEIVASPGPVSNDETITKKQVVQQSPTKPPAPSSSVMSTISSNVATAVSVPTVDFEPTDAPVELGSTFGSGLAFGTMGAAGGNISFMGNSGSGSRVVFAVDYSLSMGRWAQGGSWKSIKEVQKAIRDGGKVQKHYLVRDELYTAIKKLPQGTQYQIVMFSAWGWAHDAVKDEWIKDPKIYADNGDFFKKLIGQAKAHSRGSGANLENYEFPKYKYLTASPANIDRTCEIVEKLPTSLGTNWEHPVLMALSIKPKPDIVFFMTDGSVGDPTKALDLIREANSKGKRSVIHTTAMMEPKAAKDMATLAAQNGGKFTIVEKDGSITKGDDFFKK